MDFWYDVWHIHDAPLQTGMTSEGIQTGECMLNKVYIYFLFFPRKTVNLATPFILLINSSNKFECNLHFNTKFKQPVAVRLVSSEGESKINTEILTNFDVEAKTLL